MSDAHEDANLQMMFAGFSDDQLVAELIRRNRLRAVEYTTTYFTELADDERYMAGVDERIGFNIMRTLLDKGWIMIDDLEAGSPGHELTVDLKRHRVRRARLIVSTARE